MKFTTTTVRGHGRGRSLGYPTVNMMSLENLAFSLPQGVYAAKAVIDGKKYNGALFYGSAPTFEDRDISLEIFLFGVNESFYVEEGELITIETIKYVRGVESFDSPELLIIQMDKDVAKIQEILKEK